MITALFLFAFLVKNEEIRSSYPEEAITLPPSQEVLGQNFVVGIPGTSLDEETRIFLEQIRPGGVILYYRNYETPEQFRNFISELQEVAARTTQYPYFIMIDEEPGGATRLNLFKNVFAFGTPEWERIEQDIKTMADIGVNVNLAPLADFPFDEDSFIKYRIQAHTPAALVDFNKKFIALSQQNDVSTTLKHFPGMGVFVEDPHDTLPRASVGKTVLDESLEIFESGITAGTDFVMTGHAVYDDIDPGVPATLSKKITTDVLRKQLGFSGLVITDDLSDMPLIIGRDIDLTEATIESLDAGHNLIMFSHRPDKTKRVFEELLERVQNDPEFRLITKNNYRRIAALKEIRDL